MNIIVPMAGMVKRMRPHTLTIPKPLIPVAGKSIVQRLVEDIAIVCNEKIDEIGFIVGNFGSEVEQNLLDIASSVGATGKIYYQEQALGTAHAVLCAAPSLSGQTVVAFADTLFKADFKLDTQKDGIIWTYKVDDPSAFGVVKTNATGIVTDFIEKPKTDVGTNQAIIGIYYFKDGLNLRNELQYLIDNNIKGNNEFQLTDALENMKLKGLQFTTDTVTEWLDCGNKDATVHTNQRVLAHLDAKTLVDASVQLVNAQIIMPCYIGKNVVIKNAVVGPYVSVGDNTVIEQSIIDNSIIQTNCKLKQAQFTNSMLGNNVEYIGQLNDLNIGDYTVIN